MLTKTVLSSDVTVLQFAVGNHIVMAFEADLTLRIKTSKRFFIRVFSHVSTKVTWCLKQVRANRTRNAFRAAWRLLSFFFLNALVIVATDHWRVSRKRADGGWG